MEVRNSSSYYKNTGCAIAVYDISNRESLIPNIINWIRDLMAHSSKKLLWF